MQMIVWLASFPRSGNTLMRLLCEQTFGVDSSALYHDEYLNVHFDFKTFENSGELFRAWASTPEMHLVKTHTGCNDRPEKTICMVRDGRASYISYWHYVWDIESKRLNLSQMIREPAACVHKLSWSDFLDSWDPISRPNVLLVKYEDVLSDPVKVIAAVSTFLEKKPINQWHNDFAEWQGMFPKFFRKGTIDSWKSEWTPALEKCFSEKHHKWMKKLGYYK